MNTNLPLLASTFGFAGVAANLVWPLMHKRSTLLIWQTVACSLMLIHFELISAHSGALIMLLAGTQATLAIQLERSPRFKYIYLGSLALTPVICFLTWQGAESIFSSLALAIVCIANFQLNQLHQRALLITAIFAWVAHNVMVGSIPGLASNGLAFCVSAIMLLRVYRNEKTLSA